MVTKYIIEMDGGLGHGNRVVSDVTAEESLYIDSEKDRLAKEHNITILRIDSNYEKYDRYEFIKKNVINTINDVINISNVDFDKANLESQQSFLIKACKMWEDGYNSKEIYTELDVHQSTVMNYLKVGNRLGLCEYSKEESKIRSCANSVFCITTNMKFQTRSIS